MTKQIDTNYIMDEVTLIGQLVEKLIGTVAVAGAVVGAYLNEHDMAQLLELRQRRMARQKLGPAAASSYEPTRIDIDTIDDLLDVLRVLPSQQSMVALLISRQTALRAKELKIEQLLMHVGQVPNTVRALLRDDMTSEEREALIEQQSPHLPEEVATMWRQELSAIHNEIAVLSEEELIKAYTTYLNGVLDSYAMGPPERFLSVHAYTALTHYNSPNPDFIETTDEGLEHQYLDDFWIRSARIVKNESCSVDFPHYAPMLGTRDPDNEPYHIKIVFEPRVKVGSLHTCPKESLAAPDSDCVKMPVGQVRGAAMKRVGADSLLLPLSARQWNYFADKKWIAAHRNGPDTTWGAGNGMVEAMVRAVCPIPPNHNRARPQRALTAEEKLLITMDAGRSDVHARRKAAEEFLSDPAVSSISDLSFLPSGESAFGPAEDVTLWTAIVRTSDEVGEEKRRVVLEWHFQDRERWMDLAHFLGGLCLLRQVDPEALADERDTAYIVYYDMPYTWNELKLVVREDAKESEIVW